jgi:hypothetical protein
MLLSGIFPTIIKFDMQKIKPIVILCLLSFCLAGCPKRDSSEIDVDEIQSHVDQIEKNLKAMRLALKAKNLSEADDQYKDAVEVMEDEANQLAAYPEIGLLKERLDEAGSNLCYEAVNISLQGFFDAIRKKDVRQAGYGLKEAQKEMARCQAKIESRDDYMALKMNLDSAPEVLTELKHDLAKAVLVEEIESLSKDFEPKMVSIRADLDKLEKDPNQKELAKQTASQISAIRSAIEKNKDFVDVPEWGAFAAKINVELAELTKKRAALVRRGKVVWTVKELLPMASKVATQAVTAKDRGQALKRVEQAAKKYKQCEAMVSESLKDEPGLARFKFKWRGARKTVSWLKAHCKANRRITERMVKRLGGQVKADKKKVKTETIKKQPTEKPTKKKKKKKKKRKRRGRIDRW